MSIFRKLIVWGCLGGVLYVLLSFHFVFFTWRDVKLLKKSELTLNYTFFSMAGKSPTTILSHDELRKDGIGDLMVDLGMISEKKLEELLDEYREDAPYR